VTNEEGLLRAAPFAGLGVPDVLSCTYLASRSAEGTGSGGPGTQPFAGVWGRAFGECNSGSPEIPIFPSPPQAAREIENAGKTANGP
jgi:hypothetical protein